VTLRILPLLREVGVAYASHWKLLVPLALVVLLPQAVGDALFGDVELDGVHDAGDVVKLAGIPISLGINLGGEALYAGILAAIVVQWRAGNPTPDLRATARNISYGRLIVLDLLLAAGTALGLILLVVPGVLVFTYLLISPTLIEIEGIRIREAIERSIDLVRGSFWRVLGVSVAVLVASDAIGTALESPLHGLHGEVAFNLLIEAVLEPFQGLTTVLLALALMKLRGQSPRAVSTRAHGGP
jgi:hypothetical protein